MRTSKVESLMVKILDKVELMLLCDIPATASREAYDIKELCEDVLQNIEDRELK